MKVAGHLHGGASLLRKMKVGATFSNLGIPARFATANPAGLTPASTTALTDSPGIGLDIVTYLSAQSATFAEALITVDMRPDTIIAALMSGAAAEGTVLTTITNTLAETAGTTITATGTGANDMTSGVVWGLTGANVGRSRTITTHTASTSFVVTVPFENDIALNDTFLFAPYNLFGDGNANYDGVGNAQLTTNLFQVDASVASGTGCPVVIFDLVLRGAADSLVEFIIQDQQYIQATN